MGGESAVAHWVRSYIVVVTLYQQRAVQEPVGWVVRIKAGETVADGLENAPTVLNRLFDGSHAGKLVLRVSGED